MPASGAVLVDGVDVRTSKRSELARTIGVGWFDRPTTADDNIVTDCLRQLDLLTFENRDVGALSGGERQRVSIAVVALVPSLGEYLDGPFDRPATLLRDPEWLADRVVDTGASWTSTDDRVNGTLWWYSASSTIAFVAAATAMVTGEAADPGLDEGHCFLRPNGYLGGIRTDRVLGVEALPAALASTFFSVVDALSEASGVRRQALWAMASDSIANRSLDVGAASGDRSRGSGFATWLIGEMASPRPAPRFVDVGGRRFTRRCSCCLIFEILGSDKRTSCPRRTPTDRLRCLEAVAREPPINRPTPQL